MHRTLFTIFSVLLGLNINAQRDTVTISGQIRCGETLLETGIVTMLNPIDSSIVAYTMTDEQGRYIIQVATDLDELLVRVTGFNVKRNVRRISVKNQTLDFKVQEESIALREVQIKAQKLWGNRDTLNYLVAAYTREHDRTIGSFRV